MAVDLLLNPAVGEMKWYEFQYHERAFTAGYEEAKREARQIENFFQPIYLKKKIKTSRINKTFIME